VETVLTVSGVLVAIVAGGVSLLQILRWGRNLAIKMDAIDNIITRELEHNHGSSIKDDVYGLAVAFGKLQREVGHMQYELRAHIRQQKGNDSDGI